MGEVGRRRCQGGAELHAIAGQAAQRARARQAAAHTSSKVRPTGSALSAPSAEVAASDPALRVWERVQGDLTPRDGRIFALCWFVNVESAGAEVGMKRSKDGWSTP